jgi:hypothetical protein
MGAGNDSPIPEIEALQKSEIKGESLKGRDRMGLLRHERLGGHFQFLLSGIENNVSISIALIYRQANGVSREKINIYRYNYIEIKI